MITLSLELRKILKEVKGDSSFVFTYEAEKENCVVGNANITIQIKEPINTKEDFSVPFFPLLKIIKKAKVSEVVQIDDTEGNWTVYIKGRKKESLPLSIEKKLVFPTENKLPIVSVAGNDIWIEQIKELSKYTKITTLYPELEYIHIINNELKACDLTSLYSFRFEKELLNIPHMMVQAEYLANVGLFKKTIFCVYFYEDYIELSNEKNCILIKTQKAIEEFFLTSLTEETEEISCSFIVHGKELDKKITEFVKKNSNYSGKRYKLPLSFVDKNIIFANELIGTTNLSINKTISLKDALLPIKEGFTWAITKEKHLVSYKEIDCEKYVVLCFA